MHGHCLPHHFIFALAVVISLAGGCRASRPPLASQRPLEMASQRPPKMASAAERSPLAESVERLDQPGDVPLRSVSYSESLIEMQDEFDAEIASEDLQDLLALAQAANPRLRRLAQEARAAWDRVPQERSLPDPMVQGSVFIEPMMMVDGDSRGILMVSQMIPWLARLDAAGKRAGIEALMVEQQRRTEALRVAEEIKGGWYRLYLLGQQLRINRSSQVLLESLLETASRRVTVGDATQGDVLLATVELGRMKEEQIMLEQQLASTKALINQRLNRPAEMPISVPTMLEPVCLPDGIEVLRSLAESYQPEIREARLRTQATAWGIEIARLAQRPDVTLQYEHMFMSQGGMDGNSSDPWQLGAGVNVPLWTGKYKSMRSEAVRRHLAAQAGVEEVVAGYDSVLFDWLQQARSADSLANLYETTILPASRQTLETDRQAYALGLVEFDRVVSDLRSLLTLEVSYHRALAERAVAIAGLQRAVGGVQWPCSDQDSAPVGTLVPCSPF